MKCACCNAEVVREMRFCLNCGTRIPGESAPEQTMPVAEEKNATEYRMPEIIAEPEEIAEDPAAPEFSEFPEIRFSWALDENDEPVVHMHSTRQKQEETVAKQDDEPPVSPKLLVRVPNLWLPTERSWAKMLLLGILTLGIYPAVIWSRMASEMDIAASRYDGRRTMPWFAMALLTVLTASVFGFVWHHRFCSRVGAELKRRKLDCQLGPRDFWLWNVLGSLILAGPVVYVHRVTKAMNLINEDYNSCG